MKSEFINLSNQRLHLLEAGEGEIVILLPSLWVTSKSYEMLGDALAGHYNVLIPDIYKGLSDFTTTASTLDQYGKIFEELLEERDIKEYYLIGISASGFIASHYVNAFHRKPKKLLLLSTTYAPIALRWRVSILYSGYTKLIIRNFVSARQMKLNGLWFKDGVRYFFKHMKQFAAEAIVAMYGKAEDIPVAPVPTKLLIAQEDEFVACRAIMEANKSVRNLEIEVIKGRHVWFFLDKESFIAKVRDFFR